jgi:hypothetical protein
MRAGHRPPHKDDLSRGGKVHADESLRKQSLAFSAQTSKLFNRSSFINEIALSES